MFEFFIYVVDCKWSSWGSWSSCTDGKRISIRKQIRKARNGGRSCNGESIKTESCNNPGIVSLINISICSKIYILSRQPDK